MEEKESLITPQQQVGKGVSWLDPNAERHPQTLRLDISGAKGPSGKVNGSIIQQLENFKLKSLRKIVAVVYNFSELDSVWAAVEKLNSDNIVELAVVNYTLTEAKFNLDLSFKASYFSKLVNALPNVQSTTLSYLEGDHNEALTYLNNFSKQLNFFYVSIGKNQNNPDLRYGIDPFQKKLTLPAVDSSNVNEIVNLLANTNPSQVDWLEVSFAKGSDKLELNDIEKLAEGINSDWHNLNRMSLIVDSGKFDEDFLRLFGQAVTAKSIILQGDEITPDVLTKAFWQFTGGKLDCFVSTFRKGTKDPEQIIATMCNIFMAQPNLKILNVNEDWLASQVVYSDKWSQLHNAAKLGGKNIQILGLPSITTWDPVKDMAACFPKVEYISTNLIYGFIAPGADAGDVIDIFKAFPSLKGVYVYHKNDKPCITFDEVSNNIVPVTGPASTKSTRAAAAVL